MSIAISGFFAVLTSLFGNRLLSAFDRRTVVLFYTGALVLSSLLASLAPNFAVFLAARAFVGMAIGGFWSLSTAIIARMVVGPDLPRAIAVLQAGSASAIVLAAPLGSFIEGLIGWRMTFFVTVPIGLAAFIWQLRVLPRMPAQEAATLGRMIGLLRRKNFAAAILSIALFFIGYNSMSIYLRPFLETVTGLAPHGVSLALLGLGLGGVTGLSLVGLALRHIQSGLLIGIPATLSVLILALVAFGSHAPVTIPLMMLFGLLTLPNMVVWNTWIADVIPDDLEAGGGLQVALIQCAIGGGAFIGGILFDNFGWSSAFLFGATLLFGSALVAAMAVLTFSRSNPETATV